jgi:hypothetical protein
VVQEQPHLWGRRSPPMSAEILPFLAFFRSTSSKDEGIQFRAYFFILFFAIFDWWATLLMGMQCRERLGSARKGQAQGRRSSGGGGEELVNSNSKKFPLK